ncbi:hypothetical protein O4G98_20760 [Zoogloeaceae bacterium G21618-S1]|nr:hypothetical protein [Zoogloeaceae bacterium G21618-S1]
MGIYKAAAIATIVGTVIAVAQFLELNGDSVTAKLPKLKEKANVTLSLDLPEYSADKNWLLAMYEASMSQPYSQSKSDSLTSLVKTALSVRDFNMAVIAADEIPFSRSKADAFHLVVDEAIKSKSSIGYAVVSADKMPYSGDKKSALDKIIRAFDGLAKAEAAANKALNAQASPAGTPKSGAH